ncbi:MAG: hypothetical protein H0V44_17160 [Planctomycetes bacterium]|nr:hypothetical protein [Planctomycetota bacterium]
MEASGNLMDATGKILFNCPSCGYRAKIPGHYLGMSIRCPGCNTAQMVEKPTDKAAETTGKTVSITRVATTPLPFTVEQAKQPLNTPAQQNVVTRTPLPGSLNALAVPATPVGQAMPSGSDLKNTVLFSCTTCAYRARIPSTYAGTSIHCPKCNAMQSLPMGGSPSTTPSTGGTVTISKVATATPAFGTPALSSPAPIGDPGLAPQETAKTSAAQVDFSDKILFTCPACKMRARLPAKYAGTTIKCPKCQVAATVPLSDAVEAATGNTVSISRVDMAKGSDAKKRPSGEIAKPASNQAKRPSGEFAAPTASAAKRPSGEFAAPPAAPAAAKLTANPQASSKKPSGEISLDELSAPTASAPAASSPFADADAEPSGDDLLGDLGETKPSGEAREGKKGVIKRRGSSTHLPAAAAERPVEKPAAKAPEKPAAKTPAKTPAKRPTPAPAPTISTTDAVSDDDDAPTRPAPARKAAPSSARQSRPDSEDATARPSGMAKFLPMVLGAVLVIALIVSAVLLVKLQGTNASLTQVQTELEQTQKDRDGLKKKLDEANQRADKSEAKVVTLTGELEAASAEAAKLKVDAQNQKSDFDKRIVDLETQLADKSKALEAATKPDPKKK